MTKIDERIAEITTRCGNALTWSEGPDDHKLMAKEDIPWLIAQLKAARAYMEKKPCPGECRGNRNVFRGVVPDGNLGYYPCSSCSSVGNMLAAFDRSRERE